MLKQLSTMVICLAASSSMAFAQVAATGQTVGTVLVNHGNGFTPVGAGAPLSQGDILSVKKGGRTSIVYASGCAVNVKPGRTVTIGQTVCDKASSYRAEVPQDRDFLVLPGAPGGGVLLGGGLIALAGIGAAIALGAQKDGIPYFPGQRHHRNPPAPTPMSP